MIRFVVVASVLFGCRISLENEPTADAGSARGCVENTASASCVAAAGRSDLTWIEQNVFATSCSFSICHGTPTAAGGLELRDGASHAALVGVSSLLEPSRKLVVANDVRASFLMLMMHSFPPEMATPPGTAPKGGFMPKGGGGILCCQKLDAMERWIMAGALKN
jgi:hypothetical protein